MASFLLLGASARIPQLFIAYVVLQAAVGRFWAARESVLNQCTLDSAGDLQDRIVVREVVLWVFSTKLPSTALLAYGAAMMAGAVALQYGVGVARNWLSTRQAQHRNFFSLALGHSPFCNRLHGRSLVFQLAFQRHPQ